MPIAPALALTGWRREVTACGKYWQWRKGSGKTRRSRYGGRFELLDEQRKAVYALNKLKQSQRPAQRAQAG